MDLGAAVIITNPNTGEQIWPARGVTAKRVAAPRWSRATTDGDGTPIGWVQLTPATLAGGDFITYPLAWIEPAV